LQRHAQNAFSLEVPATNNASAHDANSIRLVPIEEVQATLACTSRANLYSRFARGLLPSPVHFGKAVAIPSNELEQIVVAHIAGASDAQIAELVRQIHARRPQSPIAEQRAA
jgi:predicted DNA-binding transcriptional regulator AlpA